MSSQEAERQALQEAEERFRILAGLTSDFVYIVHVEKDGRRFRNVWLSESFERVFGRRAPGAAPPALAPVRPPRRPVPDPRAHRRAAWPAAPSAAKRGSSTHEGKVRWLADHARPILDPHTGKVTKVLGVLKDVTDRKLAEQRRIELEARNLSARNLESLGSPWPPASPTTSTTSWSASWATPTSPSSTCRPATRPASIIEEIGRAAQHAADLAQQLLDYSGSARFKSEGARPVGPGRRDGPPARGVGQEEGGDLASPWPPACRASRPTLPSCARC